MALLVHWGASVGAAMSLHFREKEITPHADMCRAVAFVVEVGYQASAPVVFGRRQRYASSPLHCSKAHENTKIRKYVWKNASQVSTQPTRPHPLSPWFDIRNTHRETARCNYNSSELNTRQSNMACQFETLEQLGSCVNDNIVAQIDGQTTSIDTFWLCE